MKINIIVPGLNEEKHIRKVIQAIKKEGFPNIIFVDDGSTDTSVKEAEKEQITILQHRVNLGKGAAVKTGCDYAFGEGATHVILIDADGQHNPKELQLFVDALKTADIVFGYRTLNKNMPAIFRFGNTAINKLSQYLTKLPLKDTQSGYRGLSKKAYKKVRWQATDYAMESEMILLAGKARLKYAEIPISTTYNDKYKGTTILDGIKIGIQLIWWRITR